MQVLELIIFAGLAAIVLYQLYAVLGRRVGRQPEDQPELARPALPTAFAPARLSVDEVALGGLATDQNGNQYYKQTVVQVENGLTLNGTLTRSSLVAES